MNGKDIFLGLKYIGEDLIDEAETGRFPERENPKPVMKQRIRRPLLVAAVIAMMLLLVGCAVVYLLSMQQIKLGDQTVMRDVFEYDPTTGEALAYVGQEAYTQQVLTLAGMGETPASQAAREWYAFCESYDPDGAIHKSVWGSMPEFPEEYGGYGLYTQEMKDKLDEILKKNDLKLRGEKVAFQTSKLLFRALGMENVLNPGSDAKMKIDHAAYYKNGNLDVYFDITIPGENGGEGEQSKGYLYYRPKDCFIPDTVVLTDVAWEEWNYTTASGHNVLILYSEASSVAWIFCDMPNCTASLRVDTIQRMAAEKGSNMQVTKFDVVTKRHLEQVAEAVNFSLEPELVDGWENLPDNAVPAGQEINGYTIDPVSAFTDGYGYRIILRITAPEGVALTDPDDYSTCTEAGAGVYGYCTEDGDGKLNTCHYILSESIQKRDCPDDGTYPFPEGNVIPVYWEDLYSSRYDFENQRFVTTLLTEGTWKFNISLDTADTRQIELLTAPITAKGCTGWKLDGTDVLKDLEVTSVKLRPLGIEVTSENDSADFLCFTGQFSHIVMKDGSWMEFTSWEFDQPIDLDQVAYVQLADKTILPMPGVEAQTVELLSEMVQAQWDAAYVPLPVFDDGIELLSEPITMKHLGGYVTDDTGDREPLYEYLNITSIILHPKGLAIVGPAAFDSPDTQATVTMKDGSEILLTGMGSGPYCDEPLSQLEAESTIDLSAVEEILLPDGTKLPMP
ncbi:MAG: hypothetical protein IJN20_00625 [Oscillospiraceae bacterium]|nr:hypothetical protein [Oscillospiraceae bacterium]